MQCEVEERTIRSMRTVVRYFKCGEKGHKCRECPKQVKVVHSVEGKAHQQRGRKLVHLERGKA